MITKYFLSEVGKSTINGTNYLNKILVVMPQFTQQYRTYNPKIPGSELHDYGPVVFVNGNEMWTVG